MDIQAGATKTVYILNGPHRTQMGSRVIQGVDFCHIIFEFCFQQGKMI